MKELEYPFNADYILKKSKHIKKELLTLSQNRIQKKIAVLGGSTTHDIIRILDLFLLNQGIEASFYESEFGQFWEDAMFENDALASFAPDFILIHTSNRNVINYPVIGQTEEEINYMLHTEYERYLVMWEEIKNKYHCTIIQNNFEFPIFRYMGNKDASDPHGRVNFITKLNMLFYEYANQTEGFYINDINYLSAQYGLDAWANPFYWHMYKYCLCMQAIPMLTFSLSNIIKSVLGQNKKSLVLDLDNTLWGGIVGDDGPENLEIGKETSLGQVYSEFQTYIKGLKDYGVMLNIDSKNEMENALAGLNHPEGILKPEDFILIKANWEPKSNNFVEIAKQMNILPESMVFVDDNPAEREIVKSQIAGVSVPEIGKPEEYIRILDHSGYFEITNFSEDDRKRNEMYKANARRIEQQSTFLNYADYLMSLEMKSTIRNFEPIYYARIAQLTNKSNQFNLTTKRCTQDDIEQMAESLQYVTLYGRLEDKFGDNGLVSVVIGEVQNKVLHIRLWLMSCRVLKRDMEFAMMDELVHQCKEGKIERIYGYYYPTAKNSMVKDFYSNQGFSLQEDKEGNTTWLFEIPDIYEEKNKVIKVN